MSTAPRIQTYGGRRFTPGRIALFLIIVVGFFAWQGSQKIPTGAASGTALNGPKPTSRPSGETLRVATFNIDGEDGDATADTMRGFDLIGMQEVHGKGPFSKSNQAEVLGGKLGLPWLFAPVERQWWSNAFGDGVLTSLPVQHWERFPLANENADSNREVLILRLEFAGKPLNVLMTHLERHDDRDKELATVGSLFLSMQEPAILMGDLNSPNDDQQIQLLRKTPGVIDPIGDSVTMKTGKSWDRIFARGMRCVGSGSIDKGASDHPLVWAELEPNSAK
ncbi:MAG TPA: endonuclease/exonuclease/phosphatase family protein [Tepidisphaeraceae bacterium]|jgi:endonuclease/exonuclease/phosphatase family metal-dependent hydrolase|nr:endonuclease/exonuclease/phosphatase family protein [Tepidisphaeraceae bacterium]